MVRFYNGRGTAEQWIKEGKYVAELDSAVAAIGSWPAGCVCLCSSWRTTLGLPSPAVSAQAVKHWSLAVGVQVKLIKMARPSGTALPAIGLSVVRGVAFLDGCSRECWNVSAGIAGAKLREGTTTILPRRRALQGVG